MKWKYRRRTMLLTGERSQKKEVNQLKREGGRVRANVWAERQQKGQMKNLQVFAAS